jgi:hypothetical protein
VEIKMMFKERREVKAEVSFTGGDPLIYVEPIALDKMALYVQGCNKEIGWLGHVERLDNVFLIRDVYLFKQEVHATTCEINPEGLADFVTEMYVNHGDIADDVLNNLRLWGHSHVNMSVSPSGQDDTQINTFKDANPWFIRVIANKAGEMEFSIYDFEQGIKFKNVKWVEYRSAQATLEETIKAEIAQKVTTKSYATTGRTTGNWYKDRIYDINSGKWVDTTPSKKNTEIGTPRRESSAYNFEEYEDAWAEHVNQKLYVKHEGGHTTSERDAKGELTEEFIIENFSMDELKKLAQCKTIVETRDLVESIDLINSYNGLDIMNIMDCAQNIYPQ